MGEWGTREVARKKRLTSSVFGSVSVSCVRRSSESSGPGRGVVSPRGVSRSGRVVGVVLVSRSAGSREMSSLALPGVERVNDSSILGSVSVRRVRGSSQAG